MGARRSIDRTLVYETGNEGATPSVPTTTMSKPSFSSMLIAPFLVLFFMFLNLLAKPFGKRPFDV